jgi:hypothetical protein
MPARPRDERAHRRGRAAALSPARGESPSRLRLRGARADLGRSGEGQRDHGRRQATELLPELDIINAIPDIKGIVDMRFIK